MKRFIFVLPVITILISSCEKDTHKFENRTIHVPKDFYTIQDAIDNASDHDTILVAIGTYKENINFKGKKVYLTSLYYKTKDTSIIKNTVIDGNLLTSVVFFQNGEDSTTVLDGFRIINGAPQFSDTSYYPIHFKGGGLYIKNSFPSLKNLIIEHNHMWYPHQTGIGGGIYCDSGGIKARNLIIRDNRCGSGNGGGGIYATSSDILLDSCRIKNNTTSISSYCGGMNFKNVTFIIKNSTIENNYIKQIPSIYRFASILLSQSKGKFISTIINDSIKTENSVIEYLNCTINIPH